MEPDEEIKKDNLKTDDISLRSEKQPDLYDTTYGHEKRLFDFLILTLPTIIFTVIFFLFTIISLIGIFFNFALLIPLVYLLFYYHFYEKKIFRTGNKNAEYYFEKLDSPTSVIRFNFIEKISRYSFFALVIIGLFTAFGFNFIMNSIHESNESYKKDLVQYETELKTTVNLNEDELREYYKEKVVSMNPYYARVQLINIIKNDMMKNETLNYQTQDLDFKASAKVDEINFDKINDELIKKIETISFEELKILVKNYVEGLKPNPIYLDTESSWYLIVLLISILLIPVLVFYSSFINRYTWIRKKNFHLYFSIECLNMLSYYHMSEIEKCWYFILGVRYYDKFIKKTLHMRINNLDTVLSLYLSKNPQQIQQSAKHMVTILNSDDKLQLLDSFKMKTNQKDDIPILVTDPFQNRLKDLLSFSIPIITTILAILTFIAKL